VTSRTSDSVAPEEVVFCLADEEKLRAPFGDYHHFRQHRPVFFHEPMQAWFVFRHDDVDRLFHDPRLSNDRMDAFVDTVPAEMRAEAQEMLCGTFRRWVLSIDDPEHFPDGDRFDIQREHGKHLAFGSGPHYCMGAILARREAEIALRGLFERFPSLCLDETRASEWMHFPGMRGRKSLPVRVA